MFFFFLNVDLVADSDSENSTTSFSDCDDNNQGRTVAFFLNGLVRILNWTKCFSKKALIVRSENSNPRWLHLSTIYTSNVSNLTIITTSKTTWARATYLYMLTTVRAMKTNNNMKYRAPTSVILHSSYSPHAVTFGILKRILLANLLPSPVNFLTIHEPLQLPASQRLLRM